MTRYYLPVLRLLRAVAVAIAVAVYVNLPDEGVARAQGGRCLQCLTSGGGCVANCNCRCDNPAMTGHISSCNSDGSVNMTCQNTAVTPPVFGTHTCDQEECCGETSSSCTQDSQCCDGLICNQIMGQCSTNPSPILINLEGNVRNYRLTSPSQGVEFDLNTDGVPERLAWTRSDAPIAFLVRDRNGNGTIDDGGELFGTFTRKRDGSLAANGFDALLDLDGGSEQSDGKVTSSDDVFDELAFWTDRNHNGLSEPQELSNLRAAGVTTLFTAYEVTPYVDRHGNRYWLEGTALVLKNGRERPRRTYDVIFATH